MNGQELAAWAFIIFGIIAAFWIYEMYNQKRIDRMWKRVDDKYAECVDQKMYDSDKIHAKEMNDEKNSRTIEFIDNKIRPLEETIKKIEKILNERLK